jgi:hypothetical protein
MEIIIVCLSVGRITLRDRGGKTRGIGEEKQEGGGIKGGGGVE